MIVHLNHSLVPAAEATINVFDRGFVFGDSIYEGLRAFRGKIVGLERHVRRMRAALAEARIDWDPAQLGPFSQKLVAANDLPDSFVYWQVSRGVPGPGQPVRTRTPQGPMAPTVFGYCSPQPPIERFENPPTVTAAVRPDVRWTKGWMKSTSLMGNVISSMQAVEAGAQDAIFVRDGLVAEGSATNVILALREPDGSTRLVTPSLDSVSILAGITRALILDAEPSIVARAVRVEELFRASEILLCGSTAMVTAVVELDGKPVGDGTPGPAARRLAHSLCEAIRAGLGFESLDAQPRIMTPCRTPQAVA